MPGGKWEAKRQHPLLDEADNTAMLPRARSDAVKFDSTTLTEYTKVSYPSGSFSRPTTYHLKVLLARRLEKRHKNRKREHTVLFHL